MRCLVTSGSTPAVDAIGHNWLPQYSAEHFSADALAAYFDVRDRYLTPILPARMGHDKLLE